MNGARQFYGLVLRFATDESSSVLLEYGIVMALLFLVAGAAFNTFSYTANNAVTIDENNFTSMYAGNFAQ